MIEVLRKLMHFFSSTSSQTSVPVQEYPETLRTGSKDLRLTRPQVFDPALKQFRNAFRLGEPLFNDPRLATPWHETRQKALAHLLRQVANSPLGDMVVLRGSMALKAWYGEKARRPGDVDWVVMPDTLRFGEAATSDLFQEFLERVDEVRDVENIHILFDQISADNIWTYERAQGIRLLFPYEADGLPPGEVYMDFVFDEPIPAPPVRLHVPDPIRLEEIPLLAASKELSLVWKLIWLTTDMYPQAKDLYDAVILVEDPAINLNEVNELLLSMHSLMFEPLDLRINPDEWTQLRLDYPHIQGEASDWRARLSKRLTR
jgi:hypothetical protein